LMKYFKPLNWQTINETSYANIEEELRHRLLTSFVRDNQNRFSEITQALNTGDITLAHRLAHTLKGNAGHFGKLLLLKAAGDVEQQLKDGKNLVTPQQLAALETELKAALTEFTAELAATTGTKTEARALLKNESATEVFAKLKPLLEMGNLECRELIDSLRMIPGTDTLIQQVENLDFEDALVTLAALTAS